MKTGSFQEKKDSEKMKTLKQIFIKKANVKPQTSMTLSVREARDCVKEWLQQKLYPGPKKYE